MAQPQTQRTAEPDPVIVDPEQYKVEAEDERIRVLRVRYGPKTKSVMHYHPPGVAVVLSDARCRFTFPDGRTEEHDMKAGTVMPIAPGLHLPENLSDTPFEVILIELKG